MPITVAGDKRSGSGRAFTLIEILVVISIIAILAGMIMPNFFRSKTAARNAKASVAVKQLEVALRGLLDEKKVWPDFISDESKVYRISNDDGPLFTLLTPYYEFGSLTNYPSQTTAYDPWSNPDSPASLQAYRARFDVNYDNKINIGGRDVYRSVLVWSFGENRIDESGGGDDVASWQ